MFCTKCGNEVEEQSKYCKNCGEPTYLSSEQTYETEYDARRKAVLNLLDHYYTLFSSQQPKFDERDRITLEVNNMAKLKGFWVFFFFIAIALFTANIFDYTFWEMGIQDLGFFLTIGIIGIVMPIITLIWHKSKIRKKRERAAKLNDELMEFYQSNKKIPVGFQYSNPRIIRCLQDYIISRRADSIKESINCLHSDLQNEVLLNRQGSFDSSDVAALAILVLFLDKR